jgi:hypothetical protein
VRLSLASTKHLVPRKIVSPPDEPLKNRILK